MADTGAMLQEAGVSLPSMDMSGVGTWIMIFILAVLGAVLVATLIYFLMMNMRFNKRAILFRKIGNRIIPVAEDKAMFERIGNAGDHWCRTRKLKKYLPRPKIEMGKNTYWFYEREDGEWINFELSDIDDLMRKAGVYFIDEDMRLSRIAISKNLDDRFKKQGFWDKYGNMIVTVVVVLLLTVCLIIVFNKMADLIKMFQSATGTMEHMASAVEMMAKRVGVVENVVNNSTGAMLQ